MDLTEYRHLVDTDDRYADLRFPHATPATSQDIDWVETKLGIQLPQQYADLLRVYGAGPFPWGCIFDIDAAAKDYDQVPHSAHMDLFHQNVEEDEDAFEGDYLLIWYDEAGNYAGFMNEGGKLTDEVWVYDHEVDTWEAKHPDLYTFLTEQFGR
jgi:hypothetical protein